MSTDWGVTGWDVIVMFRLVMLMLNVPVSLVADPVVEVASTLTAISCTVPLAIEWLHHPVASLAMVPSAQSPIHETLYVTFTSSAVAWFTVTEWFKLTFLPQLLATLPTPPRTRVGLRAVVMM